ncbi:MAG: hypothetical protein EXQ96_06075 [Alphaproteobacteria bacterium]|nr:hypothetical protein [Alphaproteobacteria bacterium]
MTATDRTEATARHFFEIYRTRRRLLPTPAALRPRDIDEAYAAQRRFIELCRAADRGEVAGYKIALTSPVMRKLAGIEQPCMGAIFSRQVHASGTKLAAGAYCRFSVECEIAVRLGADLPGGAHPYDRESVADAVEALMPAIEVVDDYHADYQKLDAPSLVAFNAWSAGCVLGEPVRDWRRLDLARLRGTMRIDGKEVGSGISGDVMGHTLSSLAFLANALAAQGRPLRRGMIAMTGSMVVTQWPEPGSTTEITIDGLGKSVVHLI